MANWPGMHSTAFSAILADLDALFSVLSYERAFVFERRDFFVFRRAVAVNMAEVL